MASINTVDKDVLQIFNNSANDALKHGQAVVNTALIYQNTIKFLAYAGNTNPALTKLSADVKAINGKYSIHSSSFEHCYSALYPYKASLNPSFDASFDADATAAYNILQLNSANEQRTQDIGDLIRVLFSDHSYTVYTVLSKISDDFQKNIDNASANGVDVATLPLAFDVNDYCSDILTAVKRIFVRTIASLDSEDMKKYLTNINAYVANHPNDVFIGMKNEITAAEIALSGRTKRSAILVGPAGTGKTSLVYQLARMINNADESLPETLKDKVIYELHLDAIVAGAMYRGQSEGRIKTILDAVAKLPNVILFIDEIHTILSNGGNSGSESGGEETTGNIIKPYLSRNDIQVIGATTNTEFNKFIQTDKAFARRFKKVLINEPTDEETLEIMKGTLPLEKTYFKKDMYEDTLSGILDLSKQYNMEQANPDKALTMLESAFAYATVCRANGKIVTTDDLMSDLKIEYNLNVTKTKAADTRKALKTYLVGQNAPLDNVSNYLDMIDLNLVDPNKPKVSLLLAGPTGVGKTETAKIIARNFTGNESNLITMDCNTLSSDTAVNAIFGSDPGYIGYKETSDFLAQVRQKPNCVILFDEIEKANKIVFKSLLGILDEGYAIDKGGNKISFKNAIIIFTTNLGFGNTAFSGDGIMSTSRNANSSIEEIKKFFSPEFIGRLDSIIVYNRLDMNVCKTLIERYRAKYAKFCGIDIKFTPHQIGEIRKSADVSNFGARNLDEVTKINYFKAIQEYDKKKAATNVVTGKVKN